MQEIPSKEKEGEEATETDTWAEAIRNAGLRQSLEDVIAIGEARQSRLTAEERLKAADWTPGTKNGISDFTTETGITKRSN
jgi:biotin carboxylase